MEYNKHPAHDPPAQDPPAQDSRCPTCGRPWHDADDVTPSREVTGAPERMRDSLRTSIAPIAAATTLTVVALTVALVAVAASHIAYHRSLGAAIGGLIVLCVAGAIWYAWVTAPKDRSRR